MREIKFRAWFTLKNRIVEHDSLDLRYDAKEGFTFAFDNNAVLENGDIEGTMNFELMQYTGLKDRNGKEIYEGDLLRHPPKKTWEEKNFVAFEVFYHDNDCADNHVGFQMNRLHFHGAIAGYHNFEKFLPKFTTRMEVVGNIYENPELLEVNK